MIRPVDGAWRRSWKAVRVRPRLVIATAAGVGTTLLLPVVTTSSPVTRALVGWNVGVVLYLVLALTMMARSTTERLRLRARIEDEGRWAVLALVSLAVLASLVAIGLQLGAARELAGASRARHVGLAAFTVITSWAFMQVMFAMHYAHEFHVPRDGRDSGGMDFPGTPSPDYLDFVYAASIIGTSAQTADVTFTSSAMRRTALLHCVLAFFFNTTVLALAINIAAGLL